MGLFGGSVIKNLPANTEDIGLILGSGRSPEKEMATHDSILAWKIPWTEESDGLQSRGLQRVGFNLGTKQQQQKPLFSSTIYMFCLAFLVSLS